MRGFYVLVLGLLAAGCSVETDDGCTVRDDADGAQVITCADGTRIEVRDGADGTNGADGANGVDGTDGSSCTVVDNGDGSKTISCDDGTEVVVHDGEDAGGCAVEPREDGTLLLRCEDGSTQIIPVDQCDGTVRGGDFAVAGGWNTHDGATIDTTAGVLRMGVSAMCGGGGVEQRICVPPYEPGGELRLHSMAGLRGCLDADCWGAGGLEVRGGDWSPSIGAQGPTGYYESFACLGENQYGRAFSLVIKAREPFATSCPTRAAEYEFDTFELEAAPRGFCPPPGQILNGSFDAEGGIGWTLVPRGGTAEWIFDGTDREAHLAVPADTCSAPYFQGFVSVPAVPELENLALEFTATGTDGKHLEVWLGGHDLLEITGTGEQQTIHQCIKPEQFGNALPLFIGANGYDADSASCLGGIDWRFDDIHYVSDPNCVPVP